MNTSIIIKFISGFGIIAFLFSACNDFLDREPLSDVTPESYFTDVSHLAAYAIDKYGYIPHSSPGYWMPTDVNTDNQATLWASSVFVPGEYKVPSTGGNWSFDGIRQCNYFLRRVLPKYKQGEITGTDVAIRHHIGEMYFLRACVYFGKLQSFGDYPIVTQEFTDDKENLVKAVKRQPRNLVSRFILADIDTALSYLSDVSPVTANKTQINKDVAQQFRSRVALYEGTWLKYHKGSARVPGGEGWPGVTADINYPAGDIARESEFFLAEAMKSAKIVADKYSLTPNDGGVPQPGEAPVPYAVGQNRYFEMFGDVDMSGYSEVIMWREYKIGVMGNLLSRAFREDNAGIGVTKSAVENFLMEDGKPLYASEYDYQDDSIALVRKHRDNRIYLFLKEPGQYNLWINKGAGTHETNSIEDYPWVTGANNGHEGRMFTGYAVRKYMNPDAVHAINTGGGIGFVVFRASEAYLNYIEASYELNGALDNNALEYWRQLRSRAHLPADPFVTINATDISQEAPNDWSAYSAGKLLTDNVLYNIRRERRCELLSEGYRYEDLKRWCSFDQLETHPYIVEGFKLWGQMQNWYKENGVSYLKYASDKNDNNVSPPPSAGGSVYLQPYRANANNKVYDGYKWNKAHYLEPIAVSHFTQSSVDGTVNGSLIYQNPGWSKEADTGPTN
ncbi:MAG: RagB/SusD family nutrient uptake outer membrane protein [Bacteroidales bacterium]